MAQAGIPVPAEEAVFPLFHEFLADIGDSQSIEQNLSTFSAHIVNLNRLAGIAGPDSLVLLDELGSATDPEEGAALAVAIAAHFLHSRAWSLISTHHTSLKVYAANTDGVINAAVGFDEQTLAPTYELRQGVPGASAGINIASRPWFECGDYWRGAIALEYTNGGHRSISGPASRADRGDHRRAGRHCARGSRRLRERKTGWRSRG